MDSTLIKQEIDDLCLIERLIEVIVDGHKDRTLKLMAYMENINSD